MDYQETIELPFVTPRTAKEYKNEYGNKTSIPIYTWVNGTRRTAPEGEGPYYPQWQSSPVLYGGESLNFDHSSTAARVGLSTSMEHGAVVIGDFLLPDDVPGRLEFFQRMLNVDKGEEVLYNKDPLSQVFFPLFDSFEDDRKPVAVLVAWIHWAKYFEKVLLKTIIGLRVVLMNICKDAEPVVHTYAIDNEIVTYKGKGFVDVSENSHYESDSFENVKTIADGTKRGINLYQEHCHMEIRVYRVSQFTESFETDGPIWITLAVAATFIFTTFMFLLYDRLVERRQALVLFEAEQTTAIVSSLFPDSVRARLMDNGTADQPSGQMAPNRRLQSFLVGNEDDMGMEPIADFFPNCTVLFADIAGFTAWSSTRDPAQVFILLQTVYQAFDAIAKRRKVFKVETIGDSYLAVTGLPHPQSKHAVIMARFATDCLAKMDELTSELEASLGPDTGDLTMRFGIHSGPVTAGVLRGDRARFQLFGDTVNTAARMERYVGHFHDTFIVF